MKTPPTPIRFGEPQPPPDVPIDNPIAIAILMLIAIIYVSHHFGYFKTLKYSFGSWITKRKFNTLKGLKIDLKINLVD